RNVAEGRILATPEVHGKDIRLERSNRDDDEEPYRHDLGYGRYRIEGGRFLDAAQDHEMHAPQQDRRANDGGRRGAVAEDGKELAERRLDEDQTRDIGKARPDPIAGGRGKAGIVAKTRLGIGVDARVELRLAPRQGLEH